MTKKLSDSVIAARMVELHNLRRLHTHDRQQITELKKENQQLRQLVAEQQTIIETLKIQIAELQTMVFGKKKQPPTGGTPVVSIFNTPTKKLRNKASYRRPVPPVSAVTNEIFIPLPDSCACGGSFIKETITTHERYEEDIPLPNLTKDYVSRIVTKYVVQRGICSQCGKVTSAKDLGGQTVTLGSNVRLLICHLVTVMGMSYTQVANLLVSLYGITVSDGEIASILATKHQTWSPAYQKLQADIRSAPIVHVDETPWSIQQNDGHGYAWSLSDAGSQKVCYSLKQSRGATYAKALFGENTKQPFTGIRISDDYGA
jgi:hypothetical protein